MKNDIELELRAEVSLKQFKKLLALLNKEYKKISETKRLSVMFLGKAQKTIYDIRVRIDSNKNAELVIKKGAFHAHDRTETSQKIEKKQFVNTVKILSLLNFRSKLTERDNFVFHLENNITVVLVKAKSIAYVEIEKMSNEKDKKADKTELLKLIKLFDLKLIKNAKEFDNLCNRLAKYTDLPFEGSQKNIKKLEFLLKAY
jgi:hypothetical protein